MVVNWQQVNLGDVVNINPPRQLQRGHCSVHIAMEHLQPNSRSITSYSYRNFTGSGSRFRNHDTLLARITPCLENGKTAFVDFLEDNEFGHGSTEFIVLSGKEGISDNLYVYYLARLPAFREFAISLMEGTSGRQRVPTNALKRFEFYLPPLPQQKAIARILSTLDDKIELNQQMNRNLEAIASAIFKSWFVDFAPVCAKMEGREPAGMDAATAALFPDSFEDSPLGEIPRGWVVEKISQLAKISREGLDVSSYSDELFDHYSIPAFDEGKSPKIELGLQIKSNKFIVSSKAILLSKLNPHIPRIWLPAITKTYRSVCSTEFLVILPVSRISREYLYALFNSQSFFEVFKTLVTGTSGSHQRVKPEYLLTMEISVPTLAIVERFTELVKPLYEQIQQNIFESRTLATIRNTLLPKLMSGEIRVKEAEKILEAVA